MATIVKEETGNSFMAETSAAVSYIDIFLIHLMVTVCEGKFDL
jgi:hypothetical protein